MNMNLEEINKKIILSEIISKYMKLIKKNSLYWGKCIFHKEQTPSFAVNNDKAYYHCFGCGAHGNVFNFLMFVNNKTFKEIVEELCETYKIPYQKTNIINYVHNQTIELILNTALELYKTFLEKNIKILEYLYARQIDGVLIEKFSLGYADGNNVVIELLKKFTLDEIKKAGIISYGYYDRLRNRIIFPIFNEKNQVIGFGGRTITNETPKYINSNETACFHKNLSLYNINKINYGVESLYLVEGYMDTITMVANGYVNTVASMGTSISKFQLFMIFKRTKKIIILFDGDEAGKKATDRVIELILSMITSSHKIYICLLPENEDPDSFIKKNNNTFNTYTICLIDYLKHKILEKKNLLKVEDLSEAFNTCEKYINFIENHTIKKSYKLLLETYIKDELFVLKKQSNVKKTIKINNNPSIYKISREENIISIIITYPNLLDEFIEHLSLINFQNTELEKIKNNMILYYNQENFTDILNKYKNNEKIIKILKYNHLLLMKYEFCKKYLYDLLCLMPIDTTNIKLY